MNKDKIAIEVQDISKIYRIGIKEKAHDSFANAVFDFIKSPLKNYRRYHSLYNFDDIKSISSDNSLRNNSDVIWALKNISFTVKQGEVVGIIGKNGAGKSTLLKVLSRITVPTGGYAKVYGRISSLLEVGTGFHQELTGRENVYLNGTVLGMRKKEIDLKFDEIVDFSGIEKFIDTPVKRYSSGMKVRLAFAVSAHLEPEILLIDEVLAVGDANFQKKCLNKMDDVGRQGRTVLFVSHNMTAITRLCKRAILLDDSKVVADGPASEIVTIYLKSDLGTTAVQKWPDFNKAPGNDSVRLRALRVITEDGKHTETVDIRKPVGIEMEYEVLKNGKIMLPCINFFNDEGIRIFGAVDLDLEWRGRTRIVGRYKSTAWVPGNLLSEGTVYVGASMKTTAQNYWYFYIQEAAVFQVIDNMAGDSARGDYVGKLGGVVRPLLNWETEFHPA